jgi:hypothetical protein
VPETLASRAQNLFCLGDHLRADAIPGKDGEADC